MKVRQFVISILAVCAVSFAAALPASADPSATAVQQYIALFKKLAPRAADNSDAKIVWTGQYICKQVRLHGGNAVVATGITSGVASGLHTSKLHAARIIDAAVKTFCPGLQSTPASTASNPAPGTTPAPSATPAPAPTKLVLPPNSGWTQKSLGSGLPDILTASVSAGNVLLLGNAPALHITMSGFACSGQWYTSAFVEIQFLDANGNPIPNPVLSSLSTVLLGYFAGHSDINSAGCGSETFDLGTVPTATSMRIVSADRSASVNLFPGSKL